MLDFHAQCIADFAEAGDRGHPISTEYAGQVGWIYVTDSADLRQINEFTGKADSFVGGFVY